MRLLQQLSRLLDDPPPEFIFEISEMGISAARRSAPGETSFQPLEPDVLSVSPLRDNVLRPEVFAQRVQAMVPPAQGRKRRRAVLILPDYCARLTVLDFDSFPSDPAEQASLIRFRVKRSVPFDVDSAAVSFHVQQAEGKGKKLEVVVAVAALEIIARYEAPFRAAGLHPGLVTVSALSALSLIPSTESAVVAKLGGKVLTVAVVDRGLVKLIRCVELAELTPAEVFDILQPTVAYMEDELGRRPDRVFLCGFDSAENQIGMQWQEGLDIPTEYLTSRFGTPGRNNAGLLGYLESAGGR
jgi:hypothetical protein